VTRQRTYSQTFVWRFECAPRDIWATLGDTARFNEAAKLPKHDIEETPQADGSVLYIGRAKKGPFTLEWKERPVNWVMNRWFQHCREFRSGPLSHLCATLRLFPEAQGCRGEYTIDVSAANWLGKLIIKTGFFRSAAKNFGKLAAEANAFGCGRAEMPFDYRAPEPDAETRTRVATLVRAIEDSGHGHGLAQRLADEVLSFQEVDLIHLRPLKLARDWDVPQRDAIELCLEAARQGLLSMRWDILCPRCRVPKAAVQALDELPRGAHCGTCNIDYDRDFSKNVELSFAPGPGIRPIEVGEYCLFGPMSTPHILLHLTLAAGETREVEVELPPGRYRLRTLEAGPERDIEVEDGGFPAVILREDSVEAGPPGPAGTVVLRNETPFERTFVVEERRWVRDALTADRVTTLQAFRDLFSDQVLRPGDEVSVRRVTLMFTDLRGSTALYGSVGDSGAYHLVREHFSFLGQIVRAHDGAIVKTIGDAIMAAFTRSSDAFAAARDIQSRVARFNAESGGVPIVIKLGLHEGPAIAVTLNGRLDYFGSTVNMAARLQGESGGGDIVLSEEVADDPGVSQMLTGVCDIARESAELKGFDQPVTFLRIGAEDT